MANWNELMVELEESMFEGRNAVVPYNCVQELYTVVCKAVVKARQKALKKVYSDLSDSIIKSFWITIDPGSSCIKLRVSGNYRDKDVKSLYKYLLKHYVYTDDVNMPNGHLRICISIDGSPVYIQFYYAGENREYEVINNMVKVWAESSHVGKVMEDIADRVMWNAFNDVSGDSNPFMKSLYEIENGMSVC